MVHVPWAFPVTTPERLTVAVALTELFHDTCVVRSRVLESEKLPVAVSFCV